MWFALYQKWCRANDRARDTIGDVRVFGALILSIGFREDGTGFLGERRYGTVDSERVGLRDVTASAIIRVLDSSPSASSAGAGGGAAVC